MKKIFIVILTVCMLLSLTACGANQAGGSSPVSADLSSSENQSASDQELASESSSDELSPIFPVENNAFLCTPQELVDYLNAVADSSDAEIYDIPEYTENGEELRISGLSMTLKLQENDDGKLENIKLYWSDPYNSLNQQRSGAFYFGALISALCPSIGDKLSEDFATISETGFGSVSYEEDNVYIYYRMYGTNANELSIYPENLYDQPESEPASSATSSEPISESLPKGIKGSHYMDIVLGLSENGGIPEGELKSSPDETIGSYYCDSTFTDPNTGYVFTYNLLIAEDLSIISGSFSLENSFLLDNSTFVDMAKAYLGFCATMPCDAVSDNLARYWLESVIDTREESKSGTEVIFGDASYTIYWEEIEGGTGSMMLQIQRVEPEE